MSIDEFIKIVDGITNDYVNYIIDDKEFRKLILDLLLDVCDKKLEKETK